MGEPRVCFDSNIYGRALIELGSLGLKVGRYDIGCTGEYLCVDEYKDDVLVPVPAETPSNGQAIWKDAMGNPFQRLERNKLKPAIRAALGEEVETSSDMEALIFRSLREFYRCYASNDEVCEKNAKGTVLAEKVELEEKMRLQELAAEEERKEQEREKWRGQVSEAGQIRGRARLLVSLAEDGQMRDQDINPDELKRTFNKYYRKAPDMENLTKEEAEAYFTNAQNMFAEMVTTKSGSLTVKYSGARVQCQAEEHPDSTMPCQSGEKKVPAVVREIVCEGISMSDPKVIVSEGRCEPVRTASR